MAHYYNRFDNSQMPDPHISLISNNYPDKKCRSNHVEISDNPHRALLKIIGTEHILTELLYTQKQMREHFASFLKKEIGTVMKYLASGMDNISMRKYITEYKNRGLI